jgi:hypothetical protein
MDVLQGPLRGVPAAVCVCYLSYCSEVSEVLWGPQRCFREAIGTDRYERSLI